MKLSSRVGRLLLAAVFAFMIAISTAVVQGFAQGRGHGQDKKAEKFINGHDARDGRWDGRGPRPRLVPAWRIHPHRRVVWTRREHRHRRAYRLYRYRRY